MTLLDLLKDPNGPALSEADRKRVMASLKRKKTGHAWAPGTGPEGETCKTCKNLARQQFSKTYLKCGLMRARWTGGPGTDVKARDPACKFWEPLAEIEGKEALREVA